MPTYCAPWPENRNATAGVAARRRWPETARGSTGGGERRARRRRALPATTRAAVLEGAAAGLQRVGDVRQIGRQRLAVGRLSGPPPSARKRARLAVGVSSAAAVRAESTSSCERPGGPSPAGALGRLLEHDVGVGAADAEGADAGAARAAVGLPLGAARC